MGTQKWEAPGSETSILSTEMNSLADGSCTAKGTEVDNETDLALFGNFELYMGAAGSARDAGAYFALYLLYSVDGTNYPYGDASDDPPESALVGSFPALADTGADYVTLVNVPLAPLKFKPVIRNETGQAMAASGNTLKINKHNGQY
jgi:hypothetical protein